MTAPLRLGLVGQNIHHSLSPLLQQKALELSGLQGEYALFDCQNPPEFLEVLARLRRHELDGLNVTTPFKPLALQHADGWLRLGQHRAGVLTLPANTLFMQENRLIATSTDGPGLAAALLSAQVDLTGKTLLLLGAGGAGQAIAGDLLALGLQNLLVTNRSALPELFARLAKIWPDRVRVQPWGQARGLAQVDVVVHATRAGHGQAANAQTQAGIAEDFAWLPWKSWRKQQPLLVDLVYAPDLTPWQGYAQEQGLQVDARLQEIPLTTPQLYPELQEPRGILAHAGQAMLAHQAARSFEVWTGQRVDGRQLLQALLQKP